MAKQVVNPKTWKCPKCEQEITAIASEVSHRCIKNRNRFTQWEEEV